MSLTSKIAWRYLWKKKSHGAISAIAIISITGVAVATAAIICVFSVFNGFRDILISQNDKILPDVEITPAKGKVIADGDSLAAAVAELPGVESASPVVADQALAIYEGAEMPVMLRGIIPEDFRRICAMDSMIIDGRPLPADAIDNEPPLGVITTGVAISLKNYYPGSGIFLFAPRREGRINPANPLSSFFTDSIHVAGILETRQNDIDINSVYVPIELARGLFQYESQATSVIIKGKNGGDPAALAKAISAKIGNNFEVKDRARQQEINFRMVNVEKWVTGLLLTFILLIASFNIISTLTMFVLEKRHSISALRAMGLSRRRIGNIFGWESMYVTVIGAGIGILLGISLCLLQENFGLIKMHGDAAEAILRNYPVVIQWSDVPIVLIPILIIGIFTALTAASFARSRISETRQ